jgi:RNA polymerase sigma-70 factor (ECF subfamily)
LISAGESPDLLDVARCVRDARAGVQAAYSQLYRRFVPLVHGILLGRFRPALADELTQDCFATAFARLDQLQDAAKFGAWIATMARRVQPAATHGEIGDDGLDAIAADASPEMRTEARQLLATIATLAPAYRETLLLRLAEGLSGPEIAALTGLTPESVRVNLHRGMEKLRAALGLTRDGALRETQDG